MVEMAKPSIRIAVIAMTLSNVGFQKTLVACHLDRSTYSDSIRNVFPSFAGWPASTCSTSSTSFLEASWKAGMAVVEEIERCHGKDQVVRLFSDIL